MLFIRTKHNLQVCPNKQRSFEPYMCLEFVLER